MRRRAAHCPWSGSRFPRRRRETMASITTITARPSTIAEIGRCDEDQQAVVGQDQRLPDRVLRLRSEHERHQQRCRRDRQLAECVAQRAEEDQHVDVEHRAAHAVGADHAPAPGWPGRAPSTGSSAAAPTAGSSAGSTRSVRYCPGTGWRSPARRSPGWSRKALGPAGFRTAAARPTSPMCWHCPAGRATAAAPWRRRPRSCWRPPGAATPSMVPLPNFSGCFEMFFCRV